MAQKVEDAVYEVADDFGLPGSTEAAGLDYGFVEADEYLPMDEGNFQTASLKRHGIFKFQARNGHRLVWLPRVIKCNDVGGTLVLKVRFVEESHFGSCNEIDGQVASLQQEFGLEQAPGDVAELAQVYSTPVLAIVDGE